MRHRAGDRYLPVRIYSYPVHSRGRPTIEYGYIHDTTLYDDLESARAARTAPFVVPGQSFSVAQIRDGHVVEIIDYDDPQDDALDQHTEHLAWVWRGGDPSHV